MAFKIGDLIAISDEMRFSFTGLPSEIQYINRVTYTQGYVMGGYRNSSPWKNVNRTIHATDVTTNLGDLMDKKGAYCTGGFDDIRAYSYATDNAFPGTTSYVSSFNMWVETGAASPGTMSAARNDLGEFQNDGTRSWVYGGGSAHVDRHIFATNTFSNVTSGDSADYQNSNQWGDNLTGFRSKGSQKMKFQTETWSTMGNVVGGQTHSKTLPSKHGRCYIENNGNSTNGSSHMINYNVVTETGAGCNSFKPWTGGETNYEIGQNHGYGLGHCGDGCQSNHSFKTQYHTDSYTAGSTTMEPKGHDGMSSGACGSRGWSGV